MNTCTRCAAPKPLADFYRRPDGTARMPCRSCVSVLQARQYAEKGNALPATKKCATCGETKPASAFHRHTSVDGLRASCRDCRRDVKSADSKRYCAKHRESVAAYKAAYQTKNADALSQYKREWNERNKDRITEKVAAWQARNRHLVQSYIVQRRAVKKNATPSWANKKYVRMFYQFAREEQQRTGKPVHVDHIVPLQSDIVCGLHCEHNLQLLFGRDNRRKSNARWPDMP